MMEKALELICLGRVGVDLYAQQVGARLEDATSFAKYLGESTANCAYGCARLGLKVAIASRVGDEQFGNFVLEEMARAGVDTSHLLTDRQRYTALAILGIKDRNTFPLIFYRQGCADMALCAADIDAEWIGTGKALTITGTHLSSELTRGACRAALDAANVHGLRRILDIDYRPVLWGLAGLGEGATHYVDSAAVTGCLQPWLGEFDVIVGTEDEFHIVGGSDDTIAALRRVRRSSAATLVCKLGPLGCVVFPDAVGDTFAAGIMVGGVNVDVLNAVGAGDAFIAGFLRGYLRGESWETCSTYGNACGALVVSRHGCAPAMPTESELFDYLRRKDSIVRPDHDVRLNELHRKTTRYPPSWGAIYGIAFDHRVQFFEMALDVGANVERLPVLKRLLVSAVETGANKAGLGSQPPAALCDDEIGQDALNAMTGRGWWIARPVELSGSPLLQFQRQGDIGTQLRSWPAEHIVKCLVLYHPGDPLQRRLAQEDKLRQLAEACRVSGHEWLIELVPTRGQPCDDMTIPRSLQRLYHLGIRPDWWKLPPLSADGWRSVRSVIERYDVFCRGVVLLGFNKPLAEVKAGFRDAARSGICRGFTIGRTVWAQPAREWLDGCIGDAGLIDKVSGNYAELVVAWRAATSEIADDAIREPAA